MVNEELNKESVVEEGIDLYALLLKYLVYWPWFLIGVVVMVFAVWAYLRFQVPVYETQASVLIQEEKNNARGSAANPFSAIQDLGMFSMTSNFDNEVEILRSRTLVKKVVTDLNFYTSVKKKRVLGYDLPLYDNAPLKLYMSSQEAEKLIAPVKLEMKYVPEGKLTVKALWLEDPDGEVEETEKEFSKLPAVLQTPVGLIMINANDSVPVEEDLLMNGVISSPITVADDYCKRLTVEAVSKTTTIARISFLCDSRKKGVDFVNALVDQYNRDANDEKNEVAEKTAQFIEERIGIINQELGTTEDQLAVFKQRSKLTNLTSDAQLALNENSQYNKERVENETQISLVRSLQEYVNNPQNGFEVIPANIGVKDVTLNSAIEQYNTLLGERKRLLLTSSENNPAVRQMDANLESMHRGIVTTVGSVLKGLQIARRDLERQTAKAEYRISEAPQQEKEFVSISRQQEIKAALYVMLLQKREENAITLASTATNGRVIEEAQAGRFPSAPRKSMYYLAALVLGLALPFGLIYLIDLMKYKIESREDVEKLTSATVLGEVPLGVISEGGSAIVVQENRNDLMEEMFRALRTNLLFLLEKQQKVVMVTSTMPGEGKSFLAGNLAASLAFMGKKVIIVGLDIRKPGLDRVFHMSHRSLGMSGYLADPTHVDILKEILHAEVSANLDILFGGPIPPNPTELVTRGALDDAIALLKERYDYIILDTAPIGLVTDSSIISRVADLLVYVCRADYTPKRGYSYINTLLEEKKNLKIATVINGIDLSKRKHSYGYGYGYGKRYGYGYGYSVKE